jgi:hypothetical protein
VRKIDHQNKQRAIRVKEEGVQSMHRLKKPLPMIQIDDMIRSLDTEVEYKPIKFVLPLWLRNSN